ncbi:hypothetical protein J6590_005453 [Homalodisca vitripennis]|nr:hypothetical protein J6590_005453 [Homalodisca vitripennis]
MVQGINSLRINGMSLLRIHNSMIVLRVHDINTPTVKNVKDARNGTLKYVKDARQRYAECKRRENAEYTTSIRRRYTELLRYKRKQYEYADGARLQYAYDVIGHAESGAASKPLNTTEWLTEC